MPKSAHHLLGYRSCDNQASRLCRGTTVSIAVHVSSQSQSIQRTIRATENITGADLNKI